MKKLLLFGGLAFIFVYSCTKDKGNLAINPYLNCDTISYLQTVAPLIDANCSTTPGCHLTSGVAPDFTTYAAVKARVDNGIFYTRALGPNRNMPDGGPYLADSLVHVLQCWVNQGALNN